MSFDDLPQNWSDLPLDTPGLAADVADLFVGAADRDRGCVAFLLTDEGQRMAQPCLVDAVSDDVDPHDLVPFLRQLAEVLAGAGGGLVFVRGRPGSVLLTDADRRWHEVVLEACRRNGVRLLGAFLATPDVVRSYPAPLASTGELAS